MTKDSLEIFTQQGREDLATKERQEIEVIEQYLPKQMDGDELKVAVQDIISSLGVTSPAEMGKIIGVANKQLAGKADGKSIAAMVKSILAK